MHDARMKSGRSSLAIFAFVSVLVACGGKGNPPASSGTSAGGSTDTSATTTSTTITPGGDSASGASTTTTASSATPATPPDSIDAALPTDVDKTPAFARRAECPEKGGCPLLKGLVPLPAALQSQLDPAAPFFAWEQVLPR